MRQGDPSQHAREGPRSGSYQRRRYLPVEHPAPHQARGPGQADRRLETWWAMRSSRKSSVIGWNSTTGTTDSSSTDFRAVRPRRSSSRELRHRRRDSHGRSRRGCPAAGAVAAALREVRPRLQSHLASSGGRRCLRCLRRAAGDAGRRHRGALADRLADYHSKTEPVLELFRRKELVLDIDGTAAPEAIQAEIRSQLTGGAKKCHG